MKLRTSSLVSDPTEFRPKLKLHRNLGLALLTMGAVIGAPPAVEAANVTWTTGTGAGTGLWSGTSNWVSGVAPVANDNLVFGATTGTTTLTYDLALGQFGTFTFNADAPAYTIGGNAFSGYGPAGFVVNSASNVTQTININFTASANAVPITGSGNLTLNGSFSKGGTYNPFLQMNGTGVLTLGGTSTFNTAGGTNPLQVNCGTVVLAKTGTGAFNVGLNINGGTAKLGYAEQFRANSSLVFNGGTFDLNGYDTALGGGGTVAASGAAGTTGGIVTLTGLGGRVTNNAAGSGTNWLVINESGGQQASYAGTISDGATAKVGLSVIANYNQTAFIALAGANNYSGGTFIQDYYTGSSGRPEILSIGNVASIGSTGNRNLTFKGAGGNADVVLQLTGTAVTNSTQFDGITFAPGLGAAFDIADPNTQPSHRRRLTGEKVMDGEIGTCHSAGCEKKIQTTPSIGVEVQRFPAALQSHSKPSRADIGA